ncbi:MAG TPA: reverse transcriptase family protein [Candidatus Acidoferrum sp.]|nr:reverse transcriptase family protein [Candidatus Acidoferrum sp.]
MAKLEVLLGTGRERLEHLAGKAGALYNPFPKKDRQRPFTKKPKPPRKKPRIIDNPDEHLKFIQRKINQTLLKTVALPQYICGGVSGKTILDNVYIHLGASVLVKVDIKNFFREITNIQVYRVWRELLGWSPKVAGLLTRLTTFQRHLPQGAPTSTYLANLVLYYLYGPVRKHCEQRGVVYSTWVDDLAFSGNDSREVIPIVVDALRQGGFAVSHKKLIVMGPATRKVLNGVLMNRFPNVAREYEKRIRSGINKLRTHQVPLAEIKQYLRRLDGAINYISSISRRKGANLRRQLSEIK